MITPAKLIELMHEAKDKAYNAGKQYVLAKEKYAKHEAIKKIRFAQLVSTGEGRSMKERENNALVSPEWNDFVTALVELETVKNKWQLEVSRFKDDFETCRSELSLLKQEMRYNL